MLDLWILVHQHPAWVWGAIGAILLSAELATGSGWLLWPAGSAGAVAVLTTLTRFNPTTQSLIFALLTLVSTYAGRRWIRSRTGLASDDLNDAATRVVGKVARASGAFHGGSGRVFIDGKEWSAELEGGGAAEKGQKLEVTALLGGSRLRVRALS